METASPNLLEPGMEQVSRENFTVVMKWPQTSSVIIANFVIRELLLIESVPQSMVF